MKKYGLFLLVFLFLGRLCAEVPDKFLDLSKLSLQEIDSLFEQANEEFKVQQLNDLAEQMGSVYNGSMLIVKNDKVLVKKNFGYLHYYANDSMRNCDENAITFSSFFELASMSKQFTAVAVLQLVQQGRLSLSDSLHYFFPNLPYPGVTLHHLLTHTSGIPDYIDFPDRCFMDGEFAKNEDIISMLAQRKPKRLFHPGQRFVYTNTNYLLLAAIVAQVTESAFPDYVRQNLLLPAGMARSFYICEHDTAVQRVLAQGHDKNFKMLELNAMDGTIGDKGLYSTAEELFLWKKALFDDHGILADSLLQKAIVPQNILENNAKSDEEYGYGFRLENKRHYGKVIYHGGLWHGFQNLFLYRPADDLTIIFLTNRRNSAHYGKSSVVLHILDGA